VSGLVPTYRRTGSRLHAARAWVAAAYVASLCAVAVVYEHPLMLGSALVAIVAVGFAAGVLSELARAARLAVPLALLVALVNPLVSAQGLTVLVTGPVVPVLGRVDVTLEALVYGGVAALRVLVIVAAFALYSAAVNPDEVLRLFRRLSFRSALTASLATRLVPILGRDARNLARAYTLRASAAPEGGWLERLRRASVLARALAAGALERAVDVAAALEVRGFAAPRRGRGAFGSGAPWSRHDFAFAGGALALAVVCGVGAFAHLDSFSPYPGLRLGLAPLDVALALSLPLVALVPWLVPRRWRRRRSLRGGAAEAGEAALPAPRSHVVTEGGIGA
jgi:energy-coupling factor transport system permease protein